MENSLYIYRTCDVYIVTDDVSLPLATIVSYLSCEEANQLPGLKKISERLSVSETMLGVALTKHIVNKYFKFNIN